MKIKRIEFKEQTQVPGFLNATKSVEAGKGIELESTDVGVTITIKNKVIIIPWSSIKVAAGEKTAS